MEEEGGSGTSAGFDADKAKKQEAKNAKQEVAGVTFFVCVCLR